MLTRIKTLARVLESGSFTRAAEVLGISQPSVSQQIRELERQCGAPLIEQRGRKIIATSLGKALATIGRDVEFAEARAQNAIVAHRAGEAGRVVVGASMTTGTYVVPQALVKLRRARPGVAIALELGNTSQIAQAAANDAIDIGIVEGTVDVAELVVTPFAEDTLVCVSSVDDRVRGPVNAAALTDRTLLLREPGSGSREATLDALRDVRTTFVHTLEIGDPQAIAVAAMSGLGIAWLSRLTVAGFQDKLTIIDVADVKITRTFSYLRRRDRAPRPAVSAFLDALRN